METFDWAVVWQYFVALLTTVVIPFLVAGDQPTGIVRVVAWLKDLLGTSGNGTRALVAVVSIVLAVVLAYVDGALTADVFVDPNQFALMVLTLIGASQYWYGQLDEE